MKFLTSPKNVTFHAKNMRPLRLLADMFPNSGLPTRYWKPWWIPMTNGSEPDRYRGKEDFKRRRPGQQRYGRGGSEGSPYQRGIGPDEIECLICATVTPDMVFPPPRILFVIKPVSTRLSVSISGPPVQVFCMR